MADKGTPNVVRDTVHRYRLEISIGRAIGLHVFRVRALVLPFIRRFALHLSFGEEGSVSEGRLWSNHVGNNVTSRPRTMNATGQGT